MNLLGLLRENSGVIADTLLIFGAILFILPVLFKLVVIPGDQEMNQLRNQTLDYLYQQPGCMADGNYEIAGHLGVNAGKAGYVVGKLQEDGRVLFHHDGRISLPPFTCLQNKTGRIR